MVLTQILYQQISNMEKSGLMFRKGWTGAQWQPYNFYYLEISWTFTFPTEASMPIYMIHSLEVLKTQDDPETPKLGKQPDIMWYRIGFTFESCKI